MSSNVKDKLRVIPILNQCALKYRDELLDRNLLVMCSSIPKHQIFCHEFTFESGNFAHLTGCYDSKRQAANQFYEKCVNQKLSHDDIRLASNGSSRQKLAVLPKILCKNLSAKMIGDYAGTQPLLEADILTGDTCACIGFKYDKNGSGILHPNTVLQGNLSSYVRDRARVIAVFRKGISEKLYEELTYKADNYPLWDELILKENYKYLLRLLQ